MVTDFCQRTTSSDVPAAACYRMSVTIACTRGAAELQPVRHETEGVRLQRRRMQAL